MSLNFTPFEISAFLHHATGTGDYQTPKSEAYQEFLDKFIAGLELLETIEGEIYLTDRGEVLLRMFLEVPTPTTASYDPRFFKLEEIK